MAGGKRNHRYACDRAGREVDAATSHTTIATGRESAIAYTSIFITCGILGAISCTRAPSGAHLLTITCLADSVRTAVGATSHLAIEAFGAGLVGLLPFCCADRAGDRRRLSQAGSNLRGACLASVYAPVCRVVAEGAGLLLISIGCGEVSTVSFTSFLTNTSGRSVITLALLEVWCIAFFTRCALICSRSSTSGTWISAHGA